METQSGSNSKSVDETPVSENVDDKICCLSKRQLGVAIVFFGICWVSPDSVLIRAAEREQTGEGCVLFYKYVFKLLATSLGMPFIYGGIHGYLKAAKQGGWHFWLVALLEGISEAGFTLSVNHTTAANTLVMVSANPLWCAILSFIFFRERPPVHTILALLFGFCCIIVVFVGASGETPSGRESFGGNLIALATGFSLALQLTACRHAGIVHPSASLVPASLVSSVISLCIGLAVAQGKVASACVPKSGVVGLLPIAIDGAFFIPIALACFTVGPKYILSSEVGLIMLTEVLLGPLLVWLVFQETPSNWTFLGGGLLVSTLAIHEILSLRLERRGVHVRKEGSSNHQEESCQGESDGDIHIQTQVDDVDKLSVISI